MLKKANERKLTKRAQFKIQQMAFMLLAVLLFFILIAIFYVSIQYRNIHKQATSLEENKAILLARMLSDSAEFTCGSYCIDSDRILVLQNRTTYENLWPIAYIKIIKLLSNNEICNIENYPNCSIFNVYNKGKASTSSVESYVALCRTETGVKKCELGKIIIGYEVK